jgi:putative ATP-dependent endonuclease of OLD family
MNSNFEFVKGINTIIGENGSGKTNLFRAIRLILDDNLYRYAYKLDENDFNRNIGSWKGHWIIISLEFSELSDDESIQSLFIHGVGNIDGDKVEKATYNLFFRPRAGIRKKLSEIKEGDKEELKAILAKITIDDYETKFTGKSTVDFNNEDAYKELVGDFQKVKFDFEIDESKFGINIPNQLSVSKEVSFTFIKALRDVVSDFHNNRTNPLLTLLRNQSGKINEEEFKPISKRVRKLNEKIEALSDVQKIRTDIKGTIKEAVGETYSPSSLSIKSSLSDDAEKLLQSLRLFIGEPNESQEGGIHELSLGGANLIYLTLKLLEYKYQINKDTFANFLLIEEPEAHIHTHIQKTLFDNLDFGETQIIYSTHSTHISEVSKISSMNILAKKQNHAEVYQPAKNLDPKDITKLERYLDAVRSNLLFAKGVMLVEGDAEEILIPIMVKKVLGVSLDELGISLINIRSTGFKNVAQIFHEDRIKRRCSIITDLDKAIEEKDKGAEKKGSERKKKLYIFSKDNEWIKIYCAEYTFEVDFVAERNEHEVKQLISEIYTDTKTINKAKNDIDSEEAIDYGKRVLTMANNVGKGWFAIMLGKHISFQTFIPEYILDALIFTKLDFNVETLSNITEYRVQKNKEIDDDGTDFDDLNLAIEEYRNNRIALHDLIPAIEATIPDDQIIKFLKRV